MLGLFLGLALAMSVTAATPGPEDVGALLSKAKALAEALEYSDVIPAAKKVIDHPGATADQRLEAYLLHGSALAVVGQPLDAESSFRFLLRGRPEFEFPPEVSPKIIWVFRKVQHEERAIVEQTRELRRRRIADGLALELDLPEEAIGGVPIEIALRVRDPFGAVTSASLGYRRAGEPQFSALALKLDGLGVWRATVSADWTENDDGALMEYFVVTRDEADTELRTLGAPDSPQVVRLTPGTVASAEPLYTRWWFWVASVGAVAAVGIAVGFGVDAAVRLPSSDLGTYSIP